MADHLSDIELYKLARNGVFDVHPDDSLIHYNDDDRLFVVARPTHPPNGGKSYRVLGTVGEFRAVYEARQPGPAMCARAATCSHATLIWHEDA